MKGYLVLEDLKVYQGEFFGDPKWIGVGEVVFNTSLMGYHEILTDPSYFQQIIVMTTPEQGNYGFARDERESSKIYAEGFVCVELNTMDAGRKATRGDLKSELNEFSRPALSGIDTRSLTLHLRSQGTPWGALLMAANEKEAIARAQSAITERKNSLDPDWVYTVSTKKHQEFKGQKQKGRVVVVDYGSKNNIIHELQKRFHEVVLVNSRTSAKEILALEPDGIMLTNGPGDPSLVKGSVETVKNLLGQKPIFGICMGNQILALALGGKTFKLKFGHRGGNHPVRNLESGEIYMTSQNHGYAVDVNSLPSGVKMSHVNLYDGTVEGIEDAKNRAWSVQYHPEACPGPHDAKVLFDHFAEKVIR